MDQEGAKVSRMPDEYVKLPPSGEIGHSNDPNYAFEIGSALGVQVKSLGLSHELCAVVGYQQQLG